MADIRTHRSWEDWVGIVLGALIGLSPWLAGEQGSQAIMWNAIIVGVIVIGLSVLELTALQRWEEGLELLCGLWLIASPFIFGYTAPNALAPWHYGLGALVVLLALLELWQDWHRSDTEMARSSG